MNKYTQFVFEDYKFDEESKTLYLHYSLDKEINFTETYRFSFDFMQDYVPEAFQRACELLFFVAGVSYYKTYLPSEIVVKKGQIDKELKNFLDKTYQRGLGEFFYTNNLDPKTPVSFPVTVDNLQPQVLTGQIGLLIGIGGGKDSLVSTELLRSQPKVATWSVGHRPQLEPLVEETGLEHLWVERTWDQQLLELNRQGAYNGHVPISAILAAVGTVVAVLAGYKDVVVSNESSANEPNLTHNGVAINHQYSKSLEFEQDFQNLLKHSFGESLQYYSFLRPMSELHIAELFSKIGFEKYKAVFSSCNRAFVHSSDHIFWCGECPKCAFTFLIFTPFIERSKLESLFHGKNLLLDPSLGTTYRQLLGIEGDKPLECVGEIKEARSAMDLAKNQYPELDKYQYEIPKDYDYKALAPHSMPDEIYQVLLQAVRHG